MWQLPFSVWVDFARQTDRELEAIRKANEGS